MYSNLERQLQNLLPKNPDVQSRFIRDLPRRELHPATYPKPANSSSSGITSCLQVFSSGCLLTIKWFEKS